MIEAFVMHDGFHRCQAFAVRSGLHRLLQGPIGFKSMHRDQRFSFILDWNRICQMSSMTGLGTHYAIFAKIAR